MVRRRNRPYREMVGYGLGDPAEVLYGDDAEVVESDAKRAEEGALHTYAYADHLRPFINDAYMAAEYLGIRLSVADAVGAATERYEKRKASRASFLAAEEADPTGALNRYDAHDPVVYYVKLGPLVKIGTTKFIPSRLDSVSAEALLAAEFGTFALEAQRHREFQAERSHREFFHITERLCAHIAYVRAAFEKRVGKTTEEWLAEMKQLRRRVVEVPPSTSS